MQKNRDKSPAPAPSNGQSSRNNAGGGGGMFAMRAAMQQNNPFQNPGSVVSAPPATTFRPPPSGNLRHAEHFSQDARNAILSSHGGPQFVMNETAPVASSNGPEPDALSIGNVVSAGQNGNPFARRMFSPMRPQPPVPPPPVPQARNPWRPPPPVSSLLHVSLDTY